MKLLPLLAGAMLVALAGSASAETITIATVNNGDMIRMQGLTDDFTKANPDIFKFKVGIVEGKVVALSDVEAIASLPSKEELISKVLFLINAQAQRLVTVLSAVPRNLAIVVKQIGDQKGGEAA